MREPSISRIRKRLRQLEDGLNVLRETIELSRLDPSHASAEPERIASLFAAQVDAAISAVRREIRYIDGAPRARRSFRRSLAIAAMSCRRRLYLLLARRKFLDGE